MRLTHGLAVWVACTVLLLRVGLGLAQPGPSVELIEVAEINQDANAMDPWLTDDGRTIYWSTKGSVWTARRVDPGSLFKGRQMLFRGRHPTVTADGLTMVLVAPRADGREGESLYWITRATADGEFRRPQVIRELRDEPAPKNPCLSADGLTLYFNRRTAGRAGSEIVATTRPDARTAWSPPQRVPIAADKVEGALTWLQVSEDGLRLLCANEGGNGKDGNLLVWSRADRSQPFTEFTLVRPAGVVPLVGRSPRYVPATKELFFVRFPKPGEGRIWVVKNLDLAPAK